MPPNATIHFDGREHATELALTLIQQATKSILFFGSTLDNVLFNNVDCIASISDFARRNSRAQARFIVHDSQLAVAQGHRLITLAQKMTSSIHLKTSSEQHKKLKQYFLLIDDDAYLYGQNASRYTGRVSFEDAAENRQLQQLFNTVWDQGSPDLMTRRLYL